MKKFERARTEEAKELRRAAILKAATRIVDQEGFRSLTMEAVARKCGLGKATLYVYFPTREDLLFAIMQADFTGWFASFREYLRTAEHPFGPGFSEAWVGGFRDRPRTVAGITHSQLQQAERQIGEEFAVRWKRYLLNGLRDLHYELLTTVQKPVPFETFAAFLATVTGITVGLWSQSQSQLIHKDLFKNEPELAALDMDLDAQMHLTIEALLNSPTFKTLRSLRRGNSSLFV